MKTRLLSKPFVVISFFLGAYHFAQAQPVILAQQDGIKVTVDGDFTGNSQDFGGATMDNWKLVISIENLTSDVLEYNMSFSFQKYLFRPGFKEWGDQRFEYSGQLQPRSLIKKYGSQNTSADCEKCIGRAKFYTWKVTNVSQQQRNQQNTQQQQQIAFQQQQQAQAAQREAERQKEANAGKILLTTDVLIELKVDGQSAGYLDPQKQSTAPFTIYQPGEHLFEFVPVADPTKAKKEVITIESGKQVVRLIELMAVVGPAEKLRLQKILDETKQKELAAKQAEEAKEVERKRVIGGLKANTWIHTETNDTLEFINDLIMRFTTRANKFIANYGITDQGLKMFNMRYPQGDYTNYPQGNYMDYKVTLNDQTLTLEFINYNGTFLFNKGETQEERQTRIAKQLPELIRKDNSALQTGQWLLAGGTTKGSYKRLGTAFTNAITEGNPGGPFLRRESDRIFPRRKKDRNSGQHAYRQSIHAQARKWRASGRHSYRRVTP